MRLLFAISALVALAGSAAAVEIGGLGYDVRVEGRDVDVDTRETAPVGVVDAEAGAELAPVEVSGRGPACRIQESDVQASDCDAGTSRVTYEAPAVAYDVDVSLPFQAAAAQPVQDPSFREMVAYSAPLELTVPQVVAAAAAAGAMGGLAYALWRALKSGALLAFLPLATHLKASELLNDPHRKAIHELIRTEPGVSTKDIADRLGLAWGTVTHHLLKLEKARFVVSQKFGKYRRYFVNGSGLESKEAVAILRVARTGDVVEYVRAHPGASQKDVGEGMGVSSSTVLWHVKRLLKVGVLEKVRDGKSVRYYVKDAPAGGAPAAPAPPMVVTGPRF